MVFEPEKGAETIPSQAEINELKANRHFFVNQNPIERWRQRHGKNPSR
jgi:hypothetical protein